jgi:hypothetical protein
VIRSFPYQTRDDPPQYLFTTISSEAEFLPELGGVSGGVFRVQLNNTSLRATRKMAVGLTLVTGTKDGNISRHVNTYYQSTLQQEESLTTNPRTLQFVPYAIVCYASFCCLLVAHTIYHETSMAYAHSILIYFRMRSCHSCRFWTFHAKGHGLAYQICADGARLPISTVPVLPVLCQ